MTESFVVTNPLPTSKVSADSVQSLAEPPLATDDGGMKKQQRQKPRQLLSCTKCRERKVKCDRIKPCQACCARGLPKQCHFVAEDGDWTPIQQSYELRKLRAENAKLKQLLRDLRIPLDEDDTEFVASESPVSEPSNSEHTASPTSQSCDSPITRLRRRRNVKQRRAKVHARTESLYFGGPGYQSHAEPMGGVVPQLNGRNKAGGVESEAKPSEAIHDAVMGNTRMYFMEDSGVPSFAHQPFSPFLWVTEGGKTQPMSMMSNGHGNGMHTAGSRADANLFHGEGNVSHSSRSPGQTHGVQESGLGSTQQGYTRLLGSQQHSHMAALPLFPTAITTHTEAKPAYSTLGPLGYPTPNADHTTHFFPPSTASPTHALLPEYMFTTQAPSASPPWAARPAGTLMGGSEAGLAFAGAPGADVRIHGLPNIGFDPALSLQNTSWYFDDGSGTTAQVSGG
ncbi:hypothetical protein M011DRAFT_457813 [Sporormia fimetaria CBS 119925]|uniref:Zn(2)-C6 fungal-type domain-containing protein n=1 Tax=Sporormia fimetaria CBS 119925 TaxID=1340428 RepID=A0A6A6VFD7_9PLEO|nr:hypothetical protein M011DRAFT_457813 [Sporormia fimetaria CBS 119925]